MFGNASNVNLCLFFEGTGQGVAGRITNVTRLRDLCVNNARQKLHLEAGPGTRFCSYLRGKIAGSDWRVIFRDARRWFEANYETLPKDGVAEQIVFAGCTEDLRQWRVASGNGAAMSRWEGFAADIADTVELDANDPDVGTKAEAVRRQRRKIAIDVRNVCGDVEKARRRITDAINPDAFICSSESCRAWI